MTQKEILFEIQKIDEELKKRLPNEKLQNYNSGEIVHAKQMAFHKCQKRNRWVFGGNRSGKTECGAVESVWLARGIHPFRKNRKNIEMWVVSLSSQVQRDVAQAKVLSYINPAWIEDVCMLSGRKDNPLGGVIDYILLKNVFGGVSKIGFKSCDQGREKFLSWVYDEIYLNKNNDDNILYEQMEWLDNPNLKKEEIESLTSSLSSDELDARRYGKFTASGGMVYPEFDENVNVIEPFNVPIKWYDNISIDPGLNNPLSAHWYAVDYDNNIYVIAEHFEAQKGIEYHAEMIKKICDRLNWHKSNGRICALIDSAANQRTLASQKSVSELFYDYGILVNPNVNKDLFSGIQRVKTYLKNAKGESKLFIFKTCTNLIREMKSYFWGKTDVPIKKDDHALDELRYYIMSRPENKKEKPQKSIIQKDKERLYKKIKYAGKMH